MAQRVKNMRQLLIEAGIEEINRVGVTDFSVRRVATNCGVSCAAPYKHFKDKREFIACIIDFVNEQWFAQQAEILARCSGSPREQIVEIVVGYVRFLMEKPCYRSILMLKDAEFDNLYHRAKGQSTSRTQMIQAEFFGSVDWDSERVQRKIHIVRAILFGSVFLMNSGEFTYNEKMLENVRMAVDREFDLP